MLRTYKRPLLDVRPPHRQRHYLSHLLNEPGQVCLQLIANDHVCGVKHSGTCVGIDYLFQKHASKLRQHAPRGISLADV